MACGVVLPAAEPTEWVSFAATSDAFPLVRDGRAAPIIVASEDHRVVAIAARDLAADIARVTDRTPEVVDRLPGQPPSVAVLIGTLGHSPLIDSLVSSSRLDVTQIRGQWESFVITTVREPSPGVGQALVIVGSDRRGTAYGAYELSQAIGVSPWHWWADVAPTKRAELFVSAGTRRFGPPSVQYRGIFINDEDWGLQRWAARTFEPERGDIGPKTYQKVFELLLRLKANTLWPAMHPSTTPFNGFPENAPLADDYAIVMASSHAEPMLRNNVGEWKAPPAEYNYIANRDGVHAYWEERVRTNGRYENIYTIGMRGIHDSNMQGPRTDEERIRTLERVFADQRAMLARHVGNDVTRIPQMFCAYKEVLDLYRQGLKVPEDVTIVWPDDNFGYIRNFATAEERQRPGGFGVYYHISYLGRPLAYLWLCTTPPALIWQEMSKAYDHGARRIWIVNVGDIKPAEIGTEFFLQMAWDIDQWRRDNVADFLRVWAKREFGGAAAPEIAEIMAEYYELNFQRKPEHLQWWLPGQSPRMSPLTPEEIEERLAAFARITAAVERVGAQLPPEKRDAFFELVAYPVRGSALANERYFASQLYARHFDHENRLARAWAVRARRAHDALLAETAHYNEQLAGGKWRHLIALEPADNQWASMRIAPPLLPGENMLPEPGEDVAAVLSAAAPAIKPPAPDEAIALEAEKFDAKTDRDAAWEIVPGLGRRGDAVAVFPTTARRLTAEELATAGPRLEYRVNFARAGRFPVTVHLLPTHPIERDNTLEFALGVDDASPQVIALAVDDGSAAWAQGVLDGARIASGSIEVPTPGQHTVRLYGVEPGVVIDRVVIDLGGLRPSYLGPPAINAD